MEVSEETTTFLQSYFGKPLTNAARHGLKKPVDVPKVDATKCPKLDRVVKGSMSKDTKEADGMLAKLQTLLLDAVAPHILETVHSGNLTVDTSVKAAKLALQLPANASAHISKERRKTSLKDLNRDLLTLVEDDKMFTDVALMLFRDGFEKTMKEKHIEAMRCIRKTLSKTSNESFFGRAAPRANITTTVGAATTREEEAGTTRTSTEATATTIRVSEKRTSGKRTSPFSEAPKNSQSRDKLNLAQTPEIVYAYTNLPVLSILPELQHFYPSITVTQLRAKGIVPIAQVLAKRTISLAGRLSHCLDNWR